jgi:hypothetical protein
LFIKRHWVHLGSKIHGLKNYPRHIKLVFLEIAAR